MQNILPIHTSLFQGHQIEVYGTHETPLFLVNDIVCDLLGMPEPKDNRFFHENKQDTRYVMISQIARSCPTLQERFKRSKKDYIYFFTEFGLYKCLMRSNKPIAELFQEEICRLLKNIRLGAIELYVKRVEELQSQIQAATRRCTIYAIDVYSTDCESVQFTYIGSTCNFDNRISNHMSGSSNKNLRTLIKQGRQTVVRQLEEFEYFNESLRKQKEQSYVDQVEVIKRLNNANVVRSNQAIQRNPVLMEENKEVNPQADTVFECKWQQIKLFYQQFNRLPHDSVNINKGSVEYSLAQFINKIKQARKQLQLNPNVTATERHYVLTDTRIQYIEGILTELNITNFWLELGNEQLQRDIDYIKNYKATNSERYPVDGSSDEATQQGWSIVRKWRSRNKNGTITESERTLIQQQLPDFMFDVFAETLQKNIDELMAFILLNKRAPKQKENKKLQVLYVNMSKDPSKYTEEQHRQVKNAFSIQ